MRGLVRVGRRITPRSHFTYVEHIKYEFVTREIGSRRARTRPAGGGGVVGPAGDFSPGDNGGRGLTARI